MANYYASARSNYFRVKDMEAFKAWADSRELKVITQGTNPELVGLIAETEDGAWPSTLWDDEADDYVEAFISDELPPHLADGEIAVIMEVGSEKMRYLSGWAMAMDNTGENIDVSLMSIMPQAQAKWPDAKITECEY